MGNCSCYDTPKDTPEALLYAAVNSDSPASVAYKSHESEMVPEIKEIYKTFLMKKGKGITKIEIKEVDFGVLGAELLSKVFPELPSLKELILINNSIGVAGASKLADSTSSLTSLERLVITNNKLDDEGLEYIAQTMPFMTKLKEINFANNDITATGAQNLEEVLSNLEQLEVLDLIGNNIGKRCLIKIAKALSGIQTMKKFIFDETHLKPAEIASIKEALPTLYHNDNNS